MGVKSFPDIAVDGSANLDYRVRRSARAKHASIVVDRSGVEVVLPARMAEHHAERFVAARRGWIELKLQRFQVAADHVAGRHLADGGSIPVLGVDIPLSVKVDASKRPGVRVRPVESGDWFPAELHVRVASDDRSAVSESLERWYRRAAHRTVADRLDQAVGRNGTQWTGLTIRGQRTRWASCAADGRMNFNWRLMLAPEAVLDYVIEHEAAHLEVLDHSQRFWALVELRCPQWRTHRRWLKEHGDTLWL